MSRRFSFARLLGLWLVPSLLTIAVIAFLSAPFRSVAYPDVFEDDFFYYLVTARNILAGHGSTFDGIHATNGYHPLWMLVTIGMASVFHGRLLFVAFSLLIAALVLWSYSSVVDCLRPYTTRFTAQCLAAYIAINFLLLTGGMEISLAAPLLFFLCRYRLLYFHWQPRQALLYGCIAAATVLARLDAALFVILLGTSDLLLSTNVAWTRKLHALPPFLAGMSPVLLYLAFNFFVFGSAMPVSSHAKEMRFHHSFQTLPLWIIFHKLVPEVSTLTRPITLLAAVSFILLLLFGRGSLSREHRAVAVALLLFMPLHLAVLSFTSDWPVWRWYLYSCLAAALGAFLVLLSRSEPFIVRRYPLTGILSAFLFLYAAVHILAFNFHDTRSSTSGRYSFYFAAKDLAGFASSHPGIYAMGDRAGMVGYYLPAPLIQTEGLMMDNNFLRNIQSQRNLVEVLRDYHVRYFIATNPVAQGPCLLVREPAQAGPDVPVMQGRFCAQPVHTFESHDHYRSIVFDLNKE